MEIEPILVWTLILAVAIVLMGIIFSPKDKGAASTKIVQMDLEPAFDGEPGMVKFSAEKSGLITISHDGMPLHAGDTVCLVITRFSDHIKIKEKIGVVGMGPESSFNGKVTVNCIGQRWYSYRYESDVTGQWCAFEFTNVVGNEKTAELRY